jgi:hypothetical protein
MLTLYIRIPNSIVREFVVVVYEYCFLFALNGWWKVRFSFVHDVKAFQGAEEQLHSFLTSVSGQYHVGQSRS